MVHLVFILSFTLVTAWGRALSLVVQVSETLWGPDTRCPEPEVLVRLQTPRKLLLPQDTRTTLGLGDGGGAVGRTRVCQASRGGAPAGKHGFPRSATRLAFS